MRRALKIIAAVVLTWAICCVATEAHEAKRHAELAAAWEAYEAQRAEAIAAIRETEDVELKRLGLID